MVPRLLFDPTRRILRRLLAPANRIKEVEVCARNNGVLARAKPTDDHPEVRARAFRRMLTTGEVSFERNEWDMEPVATGTGLTILEALLDLETKIKAAKAPDTRPKPIMLADR